MFAGRGAGMEDLSWDCRGENGGEGSEEGEGCCGLHCCCGDVLLLMDRKVARIGSSVQTGTGSRRSEV